MRRSGYYKELIDKRFIQIREMARDAGGGEAQICVKVEISESRKPSELFSLIFPVLDMQ